MSAGLTQLIRPLALMMLIKNLGRHKCQYHGNERADECRFPPATMRPPPPFIDQREEAYKCVAWGFAQYRSTGMQRLRSDGVLTSLSTCRCRGSFVLAV
jgi:hypothetical protein